MKQLPAETSQMFDTMRETAIEQGYDEIPVAYGFSIAIALMLKNRNNPNLLEYMKTLKEVMEEYYELNA